MSIETVIRECLSAKTMANRRPLYVRNLSVYLRMFSRGRETQKIQSFDLATIEAWFASRCEAPATRRGGVGRLSALFSFAARRGYINDNPCSRMERIRVDDKPPTIFTPAEAETLLRYVAREMPWRLAHVVVGLFTGIRPVEMQRIFWRDIEIERAFIRVDASASKVRQRRIVPIPPNAVEWLAICPRTDRPIGAMRWKWIARVRRDCGIIWTKDALRHSAASYLLAKFEDCGKVSRWLGNSPTILLRNYTELVSAEDCLAFWSIRP